MTIATLHPGLRRRDEKEGRNLTEGTTARTPKSLETLIHEISNNKWTVARAEYIAARAKLEAFTRAADEVEKLIPAIPYTKEECLTGMAAIQSWVKAIRVIVEEEENE